MGANFLESFSSFSSSPLGIFCIGVVLVFTWLGWYPIRRWRLKHIPGPFGLPFLGNLPAIAASDVTAYLLQQSRRYGPVFKFWFGTRAWIVVSDADMVRKLAFKFPARPHDLNSFMHVVTGENREIDQAGIFVTEGEGWRRSRRVFEASIINPASLAAHMPAVRRQMGRLAAVLDRAAGSGEAVEAVGLLGAAYLSIVGEIAYGVDFGLLEHGGGGGGSGSGGDGEAAAQLAAGCKGVFDMLRIENASAYLPLQLMFPSAAPLIRLLAHHLPDGRQRAFMGAWTAVRRVSRQLMERWQAGRAAAAAAAEGAGGKEGAEGAEGGAPFREVGGGIAGSSFMAAMLEGRRGASEKERLSDVEVISAGFSFLLGGFETTANSTACCLHLLAAHPAAAARLAAEIDAVVGQRELTMELLDQLPYTDAVLKEALRLHPAGTFLARGAREDVDVGGGLIAPRGSILVLATHALQHDPQHWPEPQRFLPERFLPETGGALGPRNANAYAPFGLGARMCVGYKLAQMMAKCVLVTLFRRHTISLHPTKGGPLVNKTGLTYGPAEGVWLSVARRA